MVHLFHLLHVHLEKDPIAGGILLPPNEETNKTPNLAGNTFVSAAKLPRCFSVPNSPGGRSREDPMAIYFVFAVRVFTHPVLSHMLTGGDIKDLSVHVEGR
jgi:hypothetical protein